MCIRDRERGEAAVALETTGDLRRQPPLLGAVVRLLNLRGVAEQQLRQLPPAPNRPPQKPAMHAISGGTVTCVTFSIFLIHSRIECSDQDCMSLLGYE